MKNIQKLKDKYKDKIKKRKDGKQYYIYINRKQIFGKTDRTGMLLNFILKLFWKAY